MAIHIPDLIKYPYFALDTETDGLQYPRNKAFGVSVATPDGNSDYWDLRELPEVKERLSMVLPDCRNIICHYASFDYKMSLAAGIRSNPESYDDTAIRECCLNEHRHSYTLEDLATHYLGIGKEKGIYEELADIWGGPATRKSQISNIHKLEPSSNGVVAKYAKKDAVLTLRVWEEQQKAANVQDGIDELAPSIKKIWEFERRMMPHIFSMESVGIRVDTALAAHAIEQLAAEQDRVYKELVRIVGKNINVNSSPQVRELFRPEKDDQGIWCVDKVRIDSTDKGAPSLNSEALRAIAEAGDPRAELILNIRSIIKTKDTFIAGHVIGHEYDGRVYPHINQTKGEDGGTGTGRLSYQSPAMQQIPSRNKKVASVVKPIFLPEKDESWLDADENSFEVRIFAHLVGAFDSRIIHTYQRNPRTDFHQYTADLTRLPRNASFSGQANAKQLNLSMIFNSGNGAIAEKIGMEWTWSEFETDAGEIIRYRKPGKEAMEIINRYHSELPGVKLLQNKTKAVAINRGFIYTSKGRRIRFPDPRKAYKASGLLIQATAADYNKENIEIISEYCGHNGGRLILNTHDSYSMSVPGTGREEILQWWGPLQQLLEREGRARVPLLTDLSGAGPNWWAALKNEYNI